jgi:hypothetical protein
MQNLSMRTLKSILIHRFRILFRCNPITWASVRDEGTYVPECAHVPLSLALSRIFPGTLLRCPPGLWKTKSSMRLRATGNLPGMQSQGICSEAMKSHRSFPIQE